MYWTVVLAAAGAVATFALGLFAEAWRSHLTTKASSVERDKLRSLARHDRREEFELSTLLELQEIIPAMARQVGMARMAFELHYRDTGRWITGAPPLPDVAGGEESLAVRWSFNKL